MIFSYMIQIRSRQQNLRQSNNFHAIFKFIGYNSIKTRSKTLASRFQQSSADE
jgi:hypothetical protein